MTFNDDNQLKGRNVRRNSPVGWALGAIFMFAIIAVVFFYNGRGTEQTTADPNKAPNVVTGSNTGNK